MGASRAAGGVNISSGGVTRSPDIGGARTDLPAGWAISAAGVVAMASSQQAAPPSQRTVVPLFAAPVEIPVPTPTLSNPFDSPTTTTSFAALFELPVANDKSVKVSGNFALADVNPQYPVQPNVSARYDNKDLDPLVVQADTPSILSSEMLVTHSSTHKTMSPQSVPNKSAVKIQAAEPAVKVGRFKVKDITMSSPSSNEKTIQVSARRLSLSSGSIESAKQQARRMEASATADPIAALEVARDAIAAVVQDRNALAEENARLRTEVDYLRKLLVQYGARHDLS